MNPSSKSCVKKSDNEPVVRIASTNALFLAILIALFMFPFFSLTSHAPTPATAHIPLVFWCNSQHTLLSPDRCSYSLLQLDFFRHRGSINDGGSFVTTDAFPLTGKMGMRPGNILDFVSRWEGVSIREASQEFRLSAEAFHKLSFCWLNGLRRARCGGAGNVSGWQRPGHEEGVGDVVGTGVAQK